MQITLLEVHWILFEEDLLHGGNYHATPVSTARKRSAGAMYLDDLQSSTFIRN